MKRPLAIIGFTALIVLVAASSLNINSAVIMCGLSAAIFFLSMFIKKLRKDMVVPIVAATCVFALSAYAGVYYLSYKPAAALDGYQCVIEGRIVELPQGESYGKYYYIIETNSFNVNGKDRKLRLRLSSAHELYCEPYDSITAEVKLSLPSDSGMYSPMKHYRASGVYLYCYPVDSVTVTSPDTRPLMYYVQTIRQKLTESISSLMSEETSGILRGVMFGDDSAISRSDLDAIRKSGISHMLAVSGLHLSIIASFVFFLLSLFRINKKISSVVCIACVFTFMAVTGFTPSVTRAGIMNIIFFAGSLIGRRSDPYNSMGLAAIILLIQNPFAASDMGLILSFCATLGILAVQPALYKAVTSLSFVKRLCKSAYPDRNSDKDEEPDADTIKDQGDIGNASDTGYELVIGDVVLRDDSDIISNIMDMSPQQILDYRDSLPGNSDIEQNYPIDIERQSDYTTDTVKATTSNDSKDRSFSKKRGPLFKRMLYKLIMSIAGIICCTVSATIFTLPASIVFFDSVSLMSPLSNLVCTLPVSVMMICAEIASILNMIPFISVLAQPFGFISGLLAKFVLWWCRSISFLPASSLSTSSAYVMLAVGAAMLLAALAVFLSMRAEQRNLAGGKRYYVIAGLCSIIILFGGILSHQILYNDVSEIAVINQDSCSSVVIVNHGKAVVIGCGGAYNADSRVVDLLSSRGVHTIDMLIIPKSDKDYALKACELIDKYPVKSVVADPNGDYYEDIMDRAFFKGSDINRLEDAQITLWDSVQLNIITSGGDMAATISCGGTKLLYATQDADMSLLSQADRSFNLVAYDSELPANFHLIDSQSAILSGKAKFSAASMLRLKQKDIDGFLLCDYDRLVIQTRGKGDITLRQE